MTVDYIRRLGMLLVIFFPFYTIIRIFLFRVPGKRTGEGKEFWVRETVMALFFSFMAALFFFTLFDGFCPKAGLFRQALTRISGGEKINLYPFFTIRECFENMGLDRFFINIMGNIFMFVPWGFTVPFLWKRFCSLPKMAVLSLLLPIGIETAQLFVGRTVDVDDVILNFLGGFTGAWIYICGASSFTTGCKFLKSRGKAFAKFQTKQEAIDFIYESYLKAQPYQKYSDPDSKKRNPKLTEKLLNDLAFGTNVLVTGSKGKGSVSHMLTLILMSQGIKTGLVTSPHITDFCERIRVDETVICDEKLLEYADSLEGRICSIPVKQGEYVSPVGIILALAFSWFREENTKVHVLECGKGVRYDDTRNVKHDYSIITPVFKEHTRELGKTIEEIAGDKSRVIQPGQKYVFLAEQQECVNRIFWDRAKECGVSVRQYGKDFFCENISFGEEGMSFDVVTEKKRYCGIKLPLFGTHQAKNCALALALGEEISGNLKEDGAKEFLGRMHYPGRMEIVSRHPFTLLDACINPASVPMLKEIIERVPHRKLAVILAIPEDKDYLGVASALKEEAAFMVFTSTENPHYHFSENQAKKAGGFCYIEGAKKAYEYVKNMDADFICILGTTSLITDFKK